MQKHLPIMPFDVIAQSEFFFWGIILLNASATHIMGGTKTPTAEDFRNLQKTRSEDDISDQI